MLFKNSNEKAAKKIMKARDLPKNYGALLIIFNIEKIENSFNTPIYGRKSYELLFSGIRLTNLYPEEYYPRFRSGDITDNHGIERWVIAIEGFLEDESAIDNLVDSIENSGFADFVEGIQFVNFIDFYNLPLICDGRLSVGYDARSGETTDYCIISESENDMATPEFKKIFGDTHIEKHTSIKRQNTFNAISSGVFDEKGTEESKNDASFTSSSNELTECIDIFLSKCDFDITPDFKESYLLIIAWHTRNDCNIQKEKYSEEEWYQMGVTRNSAFVSVLNKIINDSGARSLQKPEQTKFIENCSYKLGELLTKSYQAALESYRRSGYLDFDNIPDEVIESKQCEFEEMSEQFIEYCFEHPEFEFEYL